MSRQALICIFAMTLSASCSLAQRINPSNPFQRGQSQMSSQDSFNALTGTIRSSDNKPLKDVRVELRDAQSGQAVGSAYTTSSGTFEFQHIHAGIYDVVATSGLEEARERVEVSNMTSMVNLRMPVSTVATDGNGRNSISVAQYKVPQKARDEIKKARECIAKQKNEEAEKHIASALEIYPKYADAMTLRGILKLDSKNQDGAIADLNEAIQYDGNNAMAYLVLGAAFNMQSKFDDAIRALERGQALSPNSWQAYFEMGKSLVGKTQYEPALRQLDRAQALAPAEYPLIHLVKAHAMLALNNYGDAMSELQAYLSKEPTGPNSEQAQKMLAQAKAFAANHPAK